MYELDLLIKDRIDPILYRNIILHSTECGTAFAATIKARLGRNPQTMFFKRSVKLLSISSYVAAADITSVLNACTGVSTLHMWNLADEDYQEPSDATPISAHDLTSLTNLRHFNCTFLPTTSLSPAITHITLSCKDASDMQTLNWVQLFRHCPLITHVMLFSWAETRLELDTFQKDPDPTRVAEDILRAYSQIHDSGSLQLVFVPWALLMLSLALMPNDWVADARPVTYGAGKLLLVYPTSVLDDIDEDEFEVIVGTQMDPADLRDLESEEGDPSRYIMHMFPGIYGDLWEFVERTGRARVLGSGKVS